ncbi:MAG: branched-chain amino acid ABC transporter permease [Microbacterium sp.]
MTFRSGVPLLIAFGLAMVLIPLLFTGSSLFTWTTAAAWALFATGTNVMFGWTGLLSFGQAAFFGMGAYTMALLHSSFPDMDGILMLVVAALAAAAVAVVFALGALRTSGAQLAILTLVLAEVLWLLTYRVPALKGEDGFSGLFSIKILGSPITSDAQLWYYTIAVVAICVWLIWLLSGSTLGRAMRAVRDDPWRSAALGIRVRKVQVVAFGVAAGFSAVAGALVAQGQGVVSPSMLTFALSGQVLVACLLGGMSSFGGPILGAVVLVWAETLLSRYVDDSNLFVGLLLLVIVLLLPQGLASLPAQLWPGKRSSFPTGPSTTSRARGGSPAATEEVAK